MPKTIMEFLKTVPPFSLLPEEVLLGLAPKITIKNCPPGSYVFRQADKSLETLFLIVKGSAEVVATNDRGDESVVGFRGEEDFFGETGLTGGQYSASIRAKEELTLLLIPGDEIEALIGRHTNFAGYVTGLLVERMRSLYEEIIHEQSFDAYNKVETPLFRRRITDIMSSPVITCKMDDLVVDAAKIMERKKISAVIVVDGGNRPVGVLTNADLVNKIVARSVTGYLDTNVGAVMNKKIVTIPSEAFFAEAMLAVSKHQTKHLAVTNRGRLVGIVTVADMVKTRSTGTLTLVYDIDSQQDIEGLARIGTETDNLLNALVAEKAPVQEILMILSELHERITRKVVQLCEQEMIKLGFGPPPVDYCWVNMGSAGRHEQTARTDQDNMIIFKDSPDIENESLGEYFTKLALLVNGGLDRCGFAKCPGNVMASNPQWCKSLAEWEELIELWIGSVSKDPQALRQLTIILDFRPVYGEKKLAETLWKSIVRMYGNSSAISHYLTQDDLRSRVPVTMWGGFATEKTGPHKDEINLKSSACVHIVNCIRIYALKNGITETSTFGRLAELRKRGGLQPDEVDFIEASFETLMMFRIRENLKKVKSGQKADNFINPSHLSKQEREILKGAFTAVSRLQKLTGSNFTLVWLFK